MTAHEPEYIHEHGPMEVSIRQVHLDEEIAELKNDKAWEREGRAGKTLVKEQGLNAVLMLMRAGTLLHEHKTGAVTIHCLAGRLALAAAGQSLEVVAGDLVALDGGVSHRVEARDEAVFLVTLAH
jgi:quercetin dioxygenase-like cupin family protein